MQDNPQSFIKSLHRSGAVIDGLQQVPELVQVLNEDRNNIKNPGKFLVTMNTGTLSTDDLVGSLPIELLPPTQGELSLLSRPPDFLDHLFAAKFIHGEHWYGSFEVWLRAIMGGYFESVLAINSKIRRDFFRDYLDNLNLIDYLIQKGFDPDELIKFSKLLPRLAQSSGGLLNPISIGNRLEEKTINIEVWLEILERLYVLHRIDNYDKRENNPLRNMSKCYISDSGLVSFFNQWEDSEHIALQSKKGMLLESLVLTELKSSISAFPHHQTKLYYYRSASDKEVDFVLTRKNSTVAVEVKSSTEVGQRELGGLRHLRDEVGANFACGVVLYTGNKVKRLGDRLYAVPVCRLWNVAKSFSA